VTTVLEDRRRLVADIVAGVAVALILIPQSLAYAELAGVPIYIGLYAAAVPPVAAAFFASSRYLQTGPVAMTALLTFGALTALAEPFTAEYAALAALLALMVGVTRILVGLLRGGVIAFFMSQPVLVGFTSAAAILIAGSQLPPAFDVEAEGGKILSRAWWTIVHPDEWQWEAIVIGVVAIAVIVGGRLLHRLFPGVMVAVAGALVYSHLTDYEGSVLGSVPTGLPGLKLSFEWGSVIDLLIPAGVIALIGFAEAAAISRTFAAQDREPWDSNREFISQGAANVASALSGGFPVGGSFSRSSVNRLSGGRTRWSGAISGLVVLAFLPFADILEKLPRAVLAAIVIVAVARLMPVGPVLAVFRFSPWQGAVGVATFLLTLALAPRIDLAVVVGVVFGIVVHLVRELTASVSASSHDGELRLEPNGVLYFGSAPAMADVLNSQLAANPNATRLIIDLSRLGRIDYTGALVLRELTRDSEGAGLDVRIVGVPPHARRILTSVWEGALPRYETTA
jgi:SulP family sulfate permease